MAADLASASLPPGPGLPRPLQTLGWIARPLPFMRRCRERYGDMFTVRIAQEGTWVFVCDPEIVRQVFTGDPAVFHAGEGNRVLLPVVGRNSVLLLDEAAHLRERKLLLPHFHGARMQRYDELMSAVARDEIAGWPRSEPLALWPRMQAITLQIIMRAVLGVRDGERFERLRRRLAALLNITSSGPSMVAMSLLGPERIRAVPMLRRATAAVDELIFAEISERRLDPQLEEREDILSLLLGARHEDGEPMSDRELRDELMTLLVAGHETTATSLAWAIERLVQHPDKLARLRAEVDAGEDEYLDAICKETLRLRPVLPIVVRKLKRPAEIGGRTLPAGVTVAPCIYLIHQREDIYPDPRRFMPERFEQRAAGTYTWIPFGGGIRRCLGASFALFEMKRVLAAIAAELELRPARPSSERVRRRAITLTPGRGAEVVVSGRRQRAAPAAGAAPSRAG